MRSTQGRAGAGLAERRRAESGRVPPPGLARQAGRAAARYVRRAPGTYVYLLILAINTFLLQHMSPRAREYFLVHHSTNLVGLHHHPVRVLIVSALWTAEPSFLLWFVVFNLFHVPVERWLGTRRWLLVVATAHVLATLISEGVVAYAVRHHEAPPHISHAIDIGVSYTVAGAVGVLTWRIARPWRWLYLGGVLVYFLLMLVADQDFTSLGHLSAALIGLSAQPLTHGFPVWNPARAATRTGERSRF
jgi:hypothetical protein